MHLRTSPLFETTLESRPTIKYDPLQSDIHKWHLNVEALFDRYGVPDVQRPQRATKYIKDEFGTELRNVLEEAEAEFGPIRWAQFKEFMVAFDRKRYLIAAVRPI